jgi:hypothetical protein
MKMFSLSGWVVRWRRLAITNKSWRLHFIIHFSGWNDETLIRIMLFPELESRFMMNEKPKPSPEVHERTRVWMDGYFYL